MIIKTGLFIKNRNGASLLEVMIAMVILTVGFLGVMALAVALTNNNATASKVNTATTIAQAQVSQLNCLGAEGLINTNSLPPWWIAVPPGWKYKYTVSPVAPNSGTRNKETTCGGPATIGIGVTLPYTVTIHLFNNPNLPSTSVIKAINAQVEVSWGDITKHVIVMNDLILSS